MSSETSTEVDRLPHAPRAERAERGFQPWQVFTLAGLIAAAIVAFYAGHEPHSVRIALILTIFAASAIGLAALRVLLPFTAAGTSRGAEMIGGRTRAALEREKTLVLRSIKELEFDHAMGKVSEKDFQEMSVRLRGRAARLLRQLDAGTGYRETIEREVDQRLARTPAPPASPAAPAVPIVPETRASCGCGTLNDSDAKFCKSCGARLEAA